MIYTDLELWEKFEQTGSINDYLEYKMTLNFLNGEQGNDDNN